MIGRTVKSISALPLKLLIPAVVILFSLVVGIMVLLIESSVFRSSFNEKFANDMFSDAEELQRSVEIFARKMIFNAFPSASKIIAESQSKLIMPIHPTAR